MAVAFLSPLFFFILILIPSFVAARHSAHPHTTNASDHHALLAFKSAITYDPFHSLSDWTSNLSFCNWTAITCSPRRQRVVSIDLSDSGLEEYGTRGTVTTKGDVYSYGIMLLEMVTAKEPTNEIFVEGLNLQKWVSMGFPNTILEVVDGRLLSETTSVDAYKVSSCLQQMICLGLLCTKESPEERPSMIDIVRILHSIRGTFLGIASTPTFQSDLTSLLASTSVVGRDEGSQSSSF